MWSKDQIKKHKKAAEKIKRIKNNSFNLIKEKEDITEHRVQSFILERFKKHNLVTDEDPPIVCFRENTSKTHYYPSKDSKTLKENTLILIDIWAKLNRPESPFADATWMAYYGDEIPQDIKRLFKVVISSRDRCLEFIDKKLSNGHIPTGEEIHSISKTYIEKAGYGEQLEHMTGHVLGFKSPHGETSIDIDEGEEKPLSINQGYTIEPGIYFPRKHGFRTEIDFYITQEKKIEVTSEIQEEIILI